MPVQRALTKSTLGLVGKELPQLKEMVGSICVTNGAPVQSAVVKYSA